MPIVQQHTSDMRVQTIPLQALDSISQTCRTSHANFIMHTPMIFLYSVNNNAAQIQGLVYMSSSHSVLRFYSGLYWFTGGQSQLLFSAVLSAVCLGNLSHLRDLLFTPVTLIH